MNVCPFIHLFKFFFEHLFQFLCFACNLAPLRTKPAAMIPIYPFTTPRYMFLPVSFPLLCPMSPSSFSNIANFISISLRSIFIFISIMIITKSPRSSVKLASCSRTASGKVSVMRCRCSPMLGDTAWFASSSWIIFCAKICPGG